MPVDKAEAYEVLVDSIRILLNKNGFTTPNDDVINDLIDKVVESVYLDLLEEEKQEVPVHVQPELPLDDRPKSTDDDACPKCGGEMANRFAGDESYRLCVDCGNVDMS